MNTEDSGEALWEDLPQLLKTILDYSICICLVVMLAVFPLYNEGSYDHIGSEKSAFFCKFGVVAGKGLAAFLVIYLIVSVGSLAAAVSREICTGGVSAFSIRKRVSEKKRIWSAASVDFFALIYCAALALSYVFSEYKEEALWGTSRWYMGLFPQLMLVSIYFIVSRFWKPRKWFFCIIFPVSAVVFLMGCLNRFDIYTFGLESVGPSFISTIGNINWYCGYAVSVMFAGTVLLWLGTGLQVWQRIFLIIYISIGYLSLFLQGSDSGLVALAVVMLVMFCMSAGDQGRMLVFWMEMTMLSAECLGIYLVKTMAPGRINMIGTMTELLTGKEVSAAMTIVSVIALILVWIDKKRGKNREKLHRVLVRVAVVGSACAVLGAVLMVVINTKYPGSLGQLSENPLFTFNDAWGSSRGATWLAGWKCFAAQDVLHKLVGVGPDCMWAYISSGSAQEVYTYVTTMFVGLRLTNAHNEWLTVLVDVGILGLVGFGGMMLCGIWELLRKAKESPFAAACGYCLLAYTVNNIFSFQQIMAVGTVFVMFGMGVAFLRQE